MEEKNWMLSPNASVATVVIPTYRRPRQLEVCLDALSRQTVKAFDTILLTERGGLAALRNDGLRRTRTPVVCFLDDDVLCPPTWLAGILSLLSDATPYLGASGPAIIPYRYHACRDVLRYQFLHQFFLDHPSRSRPGVLSQTGAISLQASRSDCYYSGYVQYLEACNMSFKTEALNAIGGFDEAYQGIGDWSEPDACFRLRRRYGPCLWFSPIATLYHCPSTTGAFTLRKQPGASRWQNYQRFSDRWLTPSWQHQLYRGVLKTYFFFKGG